MRVSVDVSVCMWKCSILTMLRVIFQSNSSMLLAANDPVVVIYRLLCFGFDLTFNFQQGGIYVLNIFDSQSGGLSLIFMVIFEAVAVSWGYGRWFQSWWRHEWFDDHLWPSSLIFITNEIKTSKLVLYIHTSYIHHLYFTSDLQE